MKFKRIAATAGLICMPLLAQSQDNCWMRSSTVTDSNNRISNISLVRNAIVDLPNGMKRCDVIVRAQVGSEWINLDANYEWFAKNQTDAEGCEMAKNLAVHRWNTKQSANIQSSQTMICSDEPGLAIRKVKEGDLIKESEVKIHPAKQNYFKYRNTRCRWFIESDVKKNDVYQWQGVICEVRPGVWSVVSKF